MGAAAGFHQADLRGCGRAPTAVRPVGDPDPPDQASPDRRRRPDILYGYGDYGNVYWGRRYATVFERAEALGLRMVGPQAPNGRQADPWPEELPADSRNVPTYHTSRQGQAGATRQLDFVFASAAIADRVEVTALNGVNEWGPSDHCRILIEVDLPVDL